MGSSTEGSGTHGDGRAGALPVHSPVPEREGKEGSHSRKTSWVTPAQFSRIHGQYFFTPTSTALIRSLKQLDIFGS